MAEVLIGAKQLERKLKDLAGNASRSANTAAMRAASVQLGKAMRRAINATSASTEVKRNARKTVGRRLTKRRGQSTSRGALVGFSVGKRNKKTGEGRSRGVGLSGTNIHWFVLGTEQRRTKSGHPTGRIEPVLQHVTAEALASGAPQAIAAARVAVKKALERRAKRR